MEVILLENIEGLGRKGDQVKVRDGFGRNHLLPYRRALLATPDVLSRLDAMKKKFATEEAKIVAQLQGTASQIEGLTLQLTMRATPEGHLFGSVNAQVLVAALKDKGFAINERDIRIKDPIKAVGTYPVAVHLHADVHASITVAVEAEGAPGEEPKDAAEAAAATAQGATPAGDAASAEPAASGS